MGDVKRIVHAMAECGKLHSIVSVVVVTNRGNCNLRSFSPKSVNARHMPTPIVGPVATGACCVLNIISKHQQPLLAELTAQHV